MRQKNFSKELAIRAGRIDGITKKSIIGHSDAVGTDLRPLYPGHSVADLNISDLIALPATVKVASTDANDTSAGTGAQIVKITGVTDAGLATTENISLSGTTEVASTTVFQAIEKIQVIAAGSGGTNAGTVWCGDGVFTAGVPATKYNSVEIGTNVSALCFGMVPSNHEWVIDQFSFYSGDTTKVLDFQIYQYSATTGLWYEAFDVHNKEGHILQPVAAYPPLEAGDAILMRTKVGTSTSIVTGAVTGYLVELSD